MQEGDIELTVAALEACGYRVRVREKNYTRWVTACKGLDVKYVTWHPLTNINQAMQLLIDRQLFIQVNPGCIEVLAATFERHAKVLDKQQCEPTPQGIINAQCRAIVNACASLKAVR